MSELMTPHEVSELFGVTTRTVSRWAKKGKLNPVRTLGGHRRFHREEVYELAELEGDPEPPSRPFLHRTSR